MKERKLMEVTKDIVSVSEMSRMLGLSRARLYQLMRDGVFPKPTRVNEGGRPFFTREQQERCLTVRRTNCGIDGRPILFYSMRSRPTVPNPSRNRRQQTRSGISRRPAEQNRDTTLTELRHGLAQLGQAEITDRAIRNVLAESFPDGHADVDSAELLRSVFERVNRQNPPDNVAR